MVPTLLDTIGRTPVVRLSRLAPAGATLYAKLESFNPGGSVKDRMALAMVEAAERSGALRPGQTVIEASSGNTGIALAMVCAAKGYPLVIVMAEQFSVERRRLMRFLGARVVLTPAHLKGSGMVEKARELAARHGWFWCRQFENEANARVHARTTGPEIVNAFAGRRLDYVVLGAGTGGTLRGVGEVLRRERPDVRIVACEPDNAPLLAGGRAQERLPDGGPAASHPDFRPHPLQGWTPDFIALHTAEAVAAGYVDRILPVPGAEALACAREVARREGVLAGATSGATIAGALRVLADDPGAHVLCLLPDTGERYLSTPLFDGIGQDMDEAEWDISRSSPAARFDAPAAAAPKADAPAAAAPTAAAPVAAVAAAGHPAATAEPAADPEARAWLAHALADPATPVQVFALAWCDYAWSLRRLFDALGLPYAWHELDGATLRADGLGTRLRAVLREHTGQATLPQVFIAGEWVGGASEVIAAHGDGRLAARAARLGLDPSCWPALDAAALLPRWRLAMT